MEDERDSYPYSPEITGRVWVVPEIENGREISVWIGGDPEGLRSLGELLIFLADADQEARHVPKGERDHIHIFPRGYCGQAFGLSGGSCSIELCRADAASTGEIYPHLLKADQEAAESICEDEEPESD